MWGIEGSYSRSIISLFLAEQVHIIVADAIQILQVSLNGMESSILVDGLTNALSIGYDFRYEIRLTATLFRAYDRLVLALQLHL